MNNIGKYILLSALLVGGFIASAQDGKVIVELQQFRQRNDSVFVDMTINLSDVKVHSNQSLLIVPVLTDGLYELPLPSVEIKGKKDYRLYQRDLALMSSRQKERYLYTKPYAVVRGYDQYPSDVQYSVGALWEPWMGNARLELRNDVCGCGGKTKGVDKEVLAEKIWQDQIEEKEKPVEITPSLLTFIQPEVEVLKIREMQAECALDFPVNQAVILPEYRNNPAELEKIKRLIDDLSANNAIRVGKVDIVGYASPEGSYERNRWLSENRAQALKEYLASRCKFQEELYQIRFGGENWEGLRESVNANNLTQAYRSSLLGLLQSERSTEEKKLALSKEVYYKEIVSQLYPSLRKAVCIINYSVKNYDSVQEIEKVYHSTPVNLSLNEMYILANSYTPGSDAFYDVFETAASLFSKDVVANVNAANSVLLRGDTKKAGSYLKRIAPDNQMPAYLNAMGVLRYLEGNREEAISYLRKAVERDSDAARKMLQMLTNN